MQLLYTNTSIKTLRVKVIFLLLSLMVTHFSCKKLIEIDPPSEQSTGSVVFSTTSSAIEALTGVYASIRSDKLFSSDDGLVIGSALLSDELQKREGSQSNRFYRNDVPPGRQFIWTSSYRDYIYRLNSIIEGVSSSEGIPQTFKAILLGEAKFLRGYIYFYLVNYYGDVPLVLTTSLTVNKDIGRSPQSEVYTQILNDLIEAQSSLRDDFLKSDLMNKDIERIRPNKGAATAMLARVYLFLQQWNKAEAEATKVLDDIRYQLVTDNIGDVFLKNSMEAIWQLQPQVADDGTSCVPDAFFLLPYPTGSLPNFIITPFLNNAFEAGDLRYTSWLGSLAEDTVVYKYAFKYKQNPEPQFQTEYVMVLRLAEQYLIRAEARARLGKLAGSEGAESDLNIIRNRAGLPNSIATTESEFIDAILHERRIELFSEGGHRWLDLKRTGKIDSVMNVICPLKGGTWQPYKSLLPIPANEFQFNPSLIGQQNPGYPER